MSFNELQANPSITVFADGFQSGLMGLNIVWNDILVVPTHASDIWEMIFVFFYESTWWCYISIGIIILIIVYIVPLTHLPLVPHLRVSESGQHWFR